MKKFLSLVLALIMTMSLVTISAGATEYRDLTDKDEIQYEEAVAVLNRIGVITGYDDGSFRPETELTRGAAAKIIVSLLIGPEAASNLPNATAPYPDVPASHTFAGVISYCKTAKIISGYGDGTFKPGNSLTGFAFAKMLLGALGYNSEIEGFVDTGWTMNVARIGHETGLFDRLDFDGAGAVNRETACQLALNTLKATMVTYGGNTMVSGAQTLVVKGTQAMYVTSNNREINANINRRVINAANNEMTLEFGEAKFKDLRLEHDKYDPAYDEYGHPSNEWSWKKVTIGTFKLPADYTFDKQMSHREDTAATKEKALGLRNFDTWSIDHRANTANWSTASSSGLWNSPFADATQITINGWDARVNATTGRIYDYDASDYNNLKKKPDGVPTISEIADLTDNGVTVEVYICPVDPDFITNVVVTRTQLMKVKRLGSDYVTLEDIEPDSRGPRKDSDLNKITGYNAFGIDVTENYDGHSSFLADVKDSNYDAYNALKDLKTGDRVAVVPYTTDNGKTWEVGEAYVPETVTGAFTKVDTYANVNKREGSAVAITVGGTSYPINEWNKDMLNVKGPEIKATKKDVTLYLAKDGTALWADEIGNADAWMVVGDYYQATGTNGKVGWFVHGWTVGGDEVDLDLGTIRGDAEKYAPGELVYYKIAESGNGEYVLSKPNKEGKNHYKDGTIAEDVPDETGEGVYEVSQYTYDAEAKKVQPYQIKSRNGALALENYDNKDGSVYKYTTAGQTDADKAVKVVNKSGSTNADGVAPGKVQHDFKYSNLLYDGVKFIFVNFDGANGEVETIDFKDGVQNVDYQDLVRYNDRWKNIGTNDGQKFVVSAAEAYVNDKGVVKAVVIKADSAEADLSKIAIITDTPGDKNLNRGADDRTNGLSYAKQYVTGPNFNISEEKTGYFDKDYPIGTILVISEKENIIVGKYFHSTYYNNGNPDAMFVKGITALTRPNGGNSEAGFLIGQKDGHTVKTLDKVYTLLETENSDKYVYGETSDVFLLGNKYVSGYDTDVENNNVKGLVRVDSATKFIDLRAINNDTIDSLGDLLNYNLDTVELRLLVNGSLSSDGFRRAYAVIVEKAGDKAVVDTGNVSLAVKDSVLPVNNIYGKVSVNRFTGRVDYTLSFKAPEWATVNGVNDLTFEMDVKANGNTFGTVSFNSSNISLTNGVYSASGSVTVPQYALDNGKIDLETDTFSGVIKNVTWAKAGVKYVYEGNTAVTDGLDAQTTSLVTSGTGNVTFKYDADDAGYVVKDGASALYVISGVTAAQTDTALKVDGSANTTSGLVAKGGEWVVVTLKNLEEAEAPEPAAKYNVAANSTLTGDSAVKIHVVPDGTTLNAAYIAALTDADWSALPVTKAAAAGEKVLVKAAAAGVNLTDVTRINDEDGNDVTSTLAVDAATYTNEKVVVFTMPAKNVRIATVDTDAIVISGAYIDKGYTNLYVKTPVAAAGTEAEMKAIVKFINESSDYSLDGVTAEYVPVLGGAGQIKITKGGASKTLTPNVANNHITVTVDGNDVIVPTGSQLATVLGLEGIATTNAIDFVRKTTGTTDTPLAFNATTALADGDKVDTNDGKGWILTDGTAANTITVTVVKTGAATDLDATTVTGSVSIDAADQFVSTKLYVRKGAQATMNVKPAANVTLTKDLKAAISVSGGTIGGTYSATAAVEALAATKVFDSTTGVNLDFIFATQTANTGVSTLTITITE